ncbi:MAG TPA: ABC transporter permease [Bryobacteraceae bacterium]|nr:ABC transporter permease [Bryobacteraceae bacterium]
MVLLRRAKSFWRFLFRKQKLEAELDRELQAYMAMLVDRHIARGLSIEEAKRAARLEFEGIEQVKEQVREVRVGANFDSSMQDIRYACRALRKSPAFTAIAILTLALGIGVNNAIFSVVYAVLLRPLPYDHPEQLALVWSGFKSATSRAPTSGPALGEILHRNRLLQGVAGIWVGNATFTGDVNPEQVKVAFVTPPFLSLLGVRPLLGRVFSPSQEFATKPELVLSYGLWQRRFGGDPSIVGKGVPFSGTNATVIGVMPQDFQLHFPPDSNVPSEVGVFFPFGNIYNRPRTLYMFRVLARLKPGVTQEQAQADMNSVAAQMRAGYTEFAAENLTMEVAPMQRDAVRDVRTALIALFAGAGFVLLICCVNVANLLLARASDRRKEIAVRSALGATQSRILRQLLIEGLVLCSIAGAVGVAIGWISLRALLSIRPDYLARMPHVGLNWPVLAFVAVVSLAAALLFGLAPGIETVKSDVIGTLREAGRTSQTPARRGIRATLIVGEVTLGFVLVIGAGLMIRTFAKIHEVQPGFEAQHLLTFELDLGKFRPNDRINFVNEWEARLASLPGVESAGGVSHLPLDDYPNWYSPYRPEGLSESDAATLLADHRAITPGYFRSMGTKLLEGRFFDAQDRAGGRQVVIVDDMLARSAWPGQSAVGKKIEAEHFTSKGIVPVWGEVVGVVEHIRNHSLSRKLRGEIYIPFEQTPREHLSFAVRTRMEPLALVEAIRRELHKSDKDLALSKVRPMTNYIERATAPVRFTAVLAGIFAGLALLLAAVGIYGVVSYSISRRMHEMGVRMALGASASDVVRLVMGEGLLLTASGLVLGVAGALIVSRYMHSLIYGISAIDPITYAVAIIVIPSAAILGCWRPASKAASANPVDAIRAE